MKILKDFPGTAVRAVGRQQVGHRSRGSVMSTPRALLGSMIALSLVLPLIWSAPASAAPAPIGDDDECVQVGDMYVQLLGFQSLMSSATYDVVDGILTVEVTGSATPFWNGDYFPSMDFWNSSDCSSGTNELPVGEYQVCASASSNDGAIGSYAVSEFWGVMSTTEFDLVLGEPYALVRESPSAQFPAVLRSISPFLNDLDFAELDDDNLIGNITATFTFGIGACGGGTAPSGGGNYDIDIDHYRKRAAAESGSLPDTM